MKLVSPNEELNHKKLAVLCADIYNYSKLTEENEDATHSSLKQRLSIVETMITRNTGTVNRLIGDSVLATFQSVSDAVYAAAEIHAASHKHNFKLNVDNQLMYRIGITYGEVIFDTEEPYGNIVNLASRIEGLVEPGGIYITERAIKDLDTTLPFRIVYRGKLRVKNIVEPVIVNEIILNKPISYKTPKDLQFLRAIDTRMLFIISLLILTIAIVIFVFSMGILFSVESML
ncbi:MAG: adenylate/guanylate cyclase domain-containing protein [Gammaproteobacteria bacterium]